METPDVPVKENAKPTKPVMFFILAGIQALCAVQVLKYSSMDWAQKSFYVLMPIGFLLLGISNWKGREIVQWFLDHFPPQERKIVYYKISCVIAILVEIAMLVSIPYFYTRYRDNIISYPEWNLSIHLAALGCSIICCISLYRVGYEVVKNYRLYKAALPQP